MSERPNEDAAPEEQLEHGDSQDRETEGATPAEIGALDGAAAAGSAAAVGDARDDDGGIPTSGPDPKVGPD
jgi:hypothetical protein